MASSSQRRILIVDDDDLFRTLLLVALRDAGYDVAIARNGADGIVSMTDDRPDLIILDLHMPVMNGWAFLRAQQGLDGFRSIPTIVVSAFERPGPAQLGSASFVAKPVDIVEFLATVKGALQPLA